LKEKKKNLDPTKLIKVLSPLLLKSKYGKK